MPTTRDQRIFDRFAEGPTAGADVADVEAMLEYIASTPRSEIKEVKRRIIAARGTVYSDMVRSFNTPFLGDKARCFPGTIAFLHLGTILMCANRVFIGERLFGVGHILLT